MDMDQQLIDEIVRRILIKSKPDRIILFGSAAGGEMTRDSDIDLLILEDVDRDRIQDERVRLGNALRGLGFPFDVLVMSTERFEESKNVIGGLAYPANKYGEVIYEAA